jgi:nucleoside-diphosphate-sugar epimerase
VVGLARSKKSAEKLRSMGAEAVEGGVEDLEALRQAASSADAVVHAAFNYDDWSKMDESYRAERAAVSAMLDALAGSDKPLIYTSGGGTIGDTGLEPVDEDVVPNPPDWVRARLEVEKLVLASAERGVRGVVVRPGLVYGRGASGIVLLMIDLAQQAGVGRTVGSGENAWSAVHIDDLGELYALAVEEAQPGSVLHAVHGEPVRMKDLAASISRVLGKGGVVQAWPVDEARQAFHFADSLAGEKRMSAARTKAELGWEPSGPTIFEDIERGSYVEIIKGKDRASHDDR